jgi:hypothetical protein
MANRYWRAPTTSTWNTVSTSLWAETSGAASGGASVPTSADDVFFDQPGTYSVTMTGAINCRSLTISAGTITMVTGTSPTLGIYGSLSLVGATINWGSTAAITFFSGGAETINTNGISLGGSVNFNNATGSWTLNAALTGSAAGGCTFTAGTINLNGFNFSIGVLSSSNANARSINFGSGGTITLTTTTLGQVNLEMSDATNFTRTGTGGLLSAASTSRTWRFGTTGGSAANSLNLTFSSTSGTQTLLTGSWFDTLTFGATNTFTPPATNLNLNSLSLGAGVYTGLTATMVGTGTVNTNGKTIANFNVNMSNTSHTCTLAGAVTTGTTVTSTLTQGNLNLNNFTLTCGAFNSDNSNIRSIAFGTGEISVVINTAAAVGLAMGNLTNFTCTGTGGFTAVSNQTRTISIGNSAGATSANAPNFRITGGSAGMVLNSPLWVNFLNLSESSLNLGGSTTDYNVNSISMGTGSYTSLNVTMRGTGTVTGNAKTIGRFTINHSGTTTFASAFGSVSYIQTAGNVDFATFNMTTSGVGSTYASGTLSNVGTLSYATLTIDGPYVFNSGTFAITSSGSTAFTLNSGSFTWNGGSVSMTFLNSMNQTGGTWILGANFTVPTTVGHTLTAGTINLNNYNWSGGVFTSNNSNTRSINFGTGTWTLGTLTAGTTNINMTTATGFSASGTGGFTAVMDRTRVFNIGTTGAPTVAPNLFLTSGSTAPTLSTGGYFGKLDFTGSTFTALTATLNISGLTLASGGTYTALTIVMVGTGTIITNGKTITTPITINSSGTTTLGDALTTSSATTITAGTLNLAGFTMTTPSVTSSSSSARSITGEGTIAVAGNWTISDGTNFTAGTYTINMTSASSKTFGGGGGSYGNLVQAGVGALTISGSNQFNNITATTRPSTITVTAGTTQTLLDFTLSGTAGNLVTINSVTSGTQFNLLKTSGTVNVNYLSIQDSNASAAFFANNTSVNVSNNKGWNFTFPSVVQAGFSGFF